MHHDVPDFFKNLSISRPDSDKRFNDGRYIVHCTFYRIIMAFSLATERLILEDLAPDDLPGIRRIASDPDVMKYVLIWLEDDLQVTGFLEHAIEESQRDDRMLYMLAVRLPVSGEFAGLSFIEIDASHKTTAEVGYILLPAHWNVGYASEILRALLAFGFEQLSLHRVYGKCDELNRLSAHVLEKGGLRYEGTIREHVWLRDHWRSTCYYGILAAEYFPSIR
jgi:[ribosomal protein S5]-alanine N-acetyltransferase